MPCADWTITAPDSFVWTPAEIAQISRAAQKFIDTLPNASNRIHHLVSLDGIKVLDGNHVVDWEQPGDEK